jgi:hypothetical protein
VDLGDVDMLVITSDKYKNDKDPCPVPGQHTDKTLKFRLEIDGGQDQHGPYTLFGCCRDGKKPTTDKKEKEPSAESSDQWCDLTRPFVISGPTICQLPAMKISQVVFKNDLALDVHVSVLVVRPCSKKCKC